MDKISSECLKLTLARLDGIGNGEEVSVLAGVVRSAFEELLVWRRMNVAERPGFDEEHALWRCPSCGDSVAWRSDRCVVCGQKFKW